MREPIRSLLADALSDLGGDLPGSWDQVVLMNSTGAITAPSDRTADPDPDRGLHLLLRSEAGHPQYYCKCRRTLSDTAGLREAKVLAMFSQNPETSPFVPRFAEARGDGLQVQVTAFVSAPRMDEVLEGLTESGFGSLVRDVNVTAFQLSRIAAEDRSMSLQTLNLVQEARSLLDDLPQIGIAGEVADHLREGLMAAGEVPYLPQHRDLWPENVFILGDGRCVIVDFDHFGLVRVPLHDTFHLLRTASESAGRMREGLWFDVVGMGDPVVMDIVGATGKELGLDASQVGGCLLYYLLDIAVGTYRRGGPESFWGRFRDELPAAASFLQTHSDIGALGKLVY